VAVPRAHLPPCEEKQRLRALYEMAAKSYAAAVNDVLANRGKTSKEDHDRLRARADEARSARNAARLALRQHKQEHGC
jgi:ElaB/YqjD/DUF883 family membrane-anchored ribosome-binding protein